MSSWPAVTALLMDVPICVALGGRLATASGDYTRRAMGAMARRTGPVARPLIENTRTYCAGVTSSVRRKFTTTSISCEHSSTPHIGITGERPFVVSLLVLFFFLFLLFLSLLLLLVG